MDTTCSTNRKFKRVLANILTILVILAIAFPTIGSADALPLCSDPLGCVTISASDPVHIAYALTLSGPSSSLGIDERNGIEIAIDDSGGKIFGHDVLLTGEDEACSAEGGATVGANLAADPTIVAVIGTSCSAAAREAMPLLSAAGFVMVSPSNTGPDLTEPGNPNNHPGYLRVSWNDKVQGAVAARFAREYLGISTAATINDGSLYSVYLQQAFADEFTNLGGTITTQETIDPGQTDMSMELTNIAAGAPEMLYFPIFMPEGDFILNQARATAGLESAYLMSSDSLWTEDIVTAAGENVEGFMVTGWDFTKNSPEYTDHFLPAYLAKFGTDPISAFHAHAYDAFMMIKSAIEQIAVVDPDGTIQIGRQALRDALYGTANFPGLTGNLTCSATGDCADPHIAVYRYHTGQFPPEYLWPLFPPPGWQQVNVNGFGDPQTSGVTSLEVFLGQLYAGATNLNTGGQVWRLGKDGQWLQVSEAGFGSGTLIPSVVDLVVFQGRLYAGIGWDDAPGQVWRSSDGTNWQLVTTDGFGDGGNTLVSNFSVFRGRLYAGTGSTNGSAQIWRSKTGNGGSWTQVAPDGLGFTGNVTGFAGYKGVLYAAIEPSGGLGAPIQVWRSPNGSDWTTVTADGFGDERNESTGGFAQFDGYLYLGTRNDATGGQIWRTGNGMRWEPVVSDGFGDVNNVKVESLLVYDDLLHAATFNPQTGVQIWRSADGMSWEQVSANGFGDSNNFATLWNNATVEYQGKILIGTWNYADGGELWMFTP
ncbi:MAG TPA: ABC transporter substrate-binding protein [Anaerolineales bacterium]|nr:ABC transporter substrate-binding protein [Anaerolineales bacterium]